MADLDDLQTAFEQVVAATNARNLDAFSALVHDEEVFFGPASPFPVEGKAARQQFFRTVSAANESVTVTPSKPQFRIIGTTGIVWSHFTFALKPKDSATTTSFVRSTYTFAKSDGKWLMVAEHHSLLPSGN
jgi:ketosteroid isomerase-like protein